MVDLLYIRSDNSISSSEVVLTSFGGERFVWMDDETAGDRQLCGQAPPRHNDETNDTTD